MSTIQTLFAVSKQLTSSLCRLEFILPVFFPFTKYSITSGFNCRPIKSRVDR